MDYMGFSKNKITGESGNTPNNTPGNFPDKIFKSQPAIKGNKRPIGKSGKSPGNTPESKKIKINKNLANPVNCISRSQKASRPNVGEAAYRFQKIPSSDIWEGTKLVNNNNITPIIEDSWQKVNWETSSNQKTSQRNVTQRRTSQ